MRFNRMASRAAPVMLAILLAAATLQRAWAISSNPIDPSQPLTVHASVFCARSGSTVVGDNAATCFFTNKVDGTALPLEEVTGTSSAAVDLAAGTMRAKATSQTLADGVNALRVGGSATASLYDTITILNIPTNQTVPVVLQMRVHGAFTSTDAVNPNTQDTDVSNSLNGFVGNDNFASTGLQIVRGNNGTPFVNSLGNLGSGVTDKSFNQVFPDPGDIQFLSSITFLASASSPTFTFTSQLAVESGLGFTSISQDPKNSAADFGNTAQFQLILPDGVGFSSASGVFLQSVPEPASLWLLAVGIAALSLRPRRN